MKQPKWSYKFDGEIMAALKKEITALDEIELEVFVDDTHSTEVSDALRLVMHAGLDPCIFSSPEWLKEMRLRYQDLERTPALLSEWVDLLAVASYIDADAPVPHRAIQSNVFPQRSRAEAATNLERCWKNAHHHDKDENGERLNDLREFQSTVPSPVATTTVTTFVNQVLEDGSYPPPEIMLSLAKSFELYLEARGELTLEQVFFGTPQQRTGVFAKKAAKDDIYLFFFDTFRRDSGMAEVTNEHVSEVKSAQSFLQHLALDEGLDSDAYDIDSFLRGYRNWKKNHPDLINRYRNK